MSGRGIFNLLVAFGAPLAIALPRGRGRRRDPGAHAAANRPPTRRQRRGRLDYFVTRCDIIDFQVNYGAYLRSGPQPRIFLLEPGRPFRAIG